MDRQQLIKEKNSIIDKITKLKSKKSKYNKMKEKINLALPQLRSAKTSINNVNTYIKQYYSGSELTKKTNSIQSYESNINTMINNLNNLIIPEIDKTIKSINNEIYYKEKRKKEIQEMLDKG